MTIRIGRTWDHARVEKLARVECVSRSTVRDTAQRVEIVFLLANHERIFVSASELEAYELIAHVGTLLPEYAGSVDVQV